MSRNVMNGRGLGIRWVAALLLSATVGSTCCVPGLLRAEDGKASEENPSEKKGAEKPAAETPSGGEKHPLWEGLQIQPGDEGLELFKPLAPVTKDEDRKNQALAWYGVAQYEFLHEDLKKSYEALKQAHLADPESAQLLVMLLQLALANNEQNAAFEYSLKLSEVAPEGNAELIRRLGASLVGQAGQGQAEGISRAVRLYEHAAKSPKINKQSAFYVFLMKELGKLYVVSQRLPDAVPCYEIVFDAIQNYEKYGLNSRERRELSSDTAVSPEKLAEVFLEAGKFGLARTAFEHSSKGRKSATGTLHYNLARVELKEQAPEKALEQLDQYFAADVSIKGKSPLLLLEETLKSLNRQGELIGRLEGYLKTKPDQVPLMTFLADRYVDSDRLPEAEGLFKKVLEEENDPQAYIGLAKVSRRLGKVPEFLDNLALAYGRKENISLFDSELGAVEQDPKLWEGLWTLAKERMEAMPPTLDYEGAYIVAHAAMKSKQNEAVDKTIRYAITKKKSDTAKLLGELADYYLDVDQFVQAGDVLKEGADDPALGNERGDFLIQASQAYELGGKTDTALQMLVEVRKSVPESASALISYQEGWVYAHSNQYDKAIERFEKAITEAKKDQHTALLRTARLNLSNVYVQKGDMRKGEEILEVILNESPDDPSVNNDLGYLYADQGKDLDKAEQMIIKALKAEPDNGAYLDSMGWVLHKKGKHQEALEYLVKSSEKSQTSADATIWDHLGDVYKALNQSDEAKKHWTKAIEMAKSAPKPNTELITKIESKLK